ncbi:MAG: ribosome biogenesis GTPase Der [Dehalococcoidia bacterium]|nr:ribosome biogenesis GTPase Der [Dehalococcoidia bacterium]
MSTETINTGPPTAVGSTPVIAIVGRPNVGKSTLFNRLVGRREAIVEDEPGTTRDRLYAHVDLDGRPIVVVDTGGLELDSSNDIPQQIRNQAIVAIAEADAIVLLVDALTGVTPDDLDVAQLLRQTKKPVLVGVNKADNRARELAAAEFYRLGLGDPIAFSAHHGRGLDDLMDAVVALLPPPPEGPADPVGSGIRIAITGRPNVGKSMLVNAILGEERVLVSPIPGTTRDAVDSPFTYRGSEMVLVDTAGIRRSGKVDQGIEKYSVFRSIRAIDRCDVAVLVVDASEGLTAQDTHVAGYIRDAHKGLVVAVNKWDLAEELELDRDLVLKRIAYSIKFFTNPPLEVVSAKTGFGVQKLLADVLKVHLVRQVRIATAEVNQVIQRAVADHPAREVQGKRLKVLYATQAAASPPTFVFFVNDPSLLHFSYRRFLENRLRDAYGFDGTAIRMVFRGREAE